MPCMYLTKRRLAHAILCWWVKDNFFVVINYGVLFVQVFAMCITHKLRSEKSERLNLYSRKFES